MKARFILIFFFMSFFVVAQDKSEVKAKAEAGTYQFIISNNKFRYIFTTEALISIEEKRKENEDITVHLSEFVDVFIPSKLTIGLKNFKPLSEYFYK